MQGKRRQGDFQVRVMVMIEVTKNICIRRGEKEKEAMTQQPVCEMRLPMQILIMHFQGDAQVMTMDKKIFQGPATLLFIASR